MRPFSAVLIKLVAADDQILLNDIPPKRTFHPAKTQESAPTANCGSYIDISGLEGFKEYN